METDSASPETGDDGTEYDYPPLLDATDEELVDEIEDRKQQARFAADAATRALLNGRPLDDATVQDLAEAGDKLRALSNTLAVRSARDD